MGEREMTGWSPVVMRVVVVDFFSVIFFLFKRLDCSGGREERNGGGGKDRYKGKARQTCRQ